jgi:hypothetical protein
VPEESAKVMVALAAVVMTVVARAIEQGLSADDINKEKQKDVKSDGKRQSYLLTRRSKDLVAITIVVVLITVFESQLFNVFAVSPSFTKQVLEDQGVSDSLITQYALNTTEYSNFNNYLPTLIEDWTDRIDKFNSTNEFRNLPIDMLTATSVSDGKFLNGTIWLSTPIYKKQHLEYENSDLKFSMHIWLYDDDYSSYFLEISPESDGTWTKTTWEAEPYSPISDITGYTNRTISVIHNYTGFFEDGNRYVDFSWDLANIGFPDKYRVSYYTQAYVNGVKLDDTPAYLTNVPIRQNTVDRQWHDFINPLQLKQGDIIDVDIPINSTDRYYDSFEEYKDGNNTDGITIDFDPSPAYIPLEGLTKVTMTIKTAENVSLGRHTIPILTKAITTVGSPYSAIETLDIEITSHLNPLEKFSNLVQAKVQENSTISASIPLVITSILGIGLARHIHRPVSKMLDLSVGKVLEIDAAVIVGVLIFLTIGNTGLISLVGLTISNNNVEFSSGQNQTSSNKNNINLTVGLLTASIVYPFALSAIRVITTGSAEKGVRFMTIGFIYLMASIVIITFLNQ